MIPLYKKSHPSSGWMAIGGDTGAIESKNEMKELQKGYLFRQHFHKHDDGNNPDEDYNKPAHH